MNLKNSGDTTGFEPMTSAMPVQCSNQLSYEVTRLRKKCVKSNEDTILTHFFHTTLLSRENMSPTN